ncbi:MAG TPA: MotA/TolQ/ExbB proton channel family protein [Tepidisphaeraceae bacterium]|jgi:biopolymer transport protein ExbB
MKRSKGLSRVLLLAVMLVAVGYLAATGFAQDTGGAAAAVDTPQGDSVLSIILGNKDFITYTIVILSVIALSLIISSALRLRQSAFVPPATVNTIREMIEQRQFKELIDYTETDTSFVAKSLNPALKRAPSFQAMKEAMETAVGEQTAEQFRKIEYLNIIGNLGPLLGLLGTVLGMIEAFSAMKAAGGSADPSILAGGISRALAHTFMGLFLAVPALAAFGILRTLVDRLTIRGALVAEELLLMIRPADSGKPAGPGTPVAPQRSPTTPPVPGRPRVNPIPQPPPAPIG